MPAYTLYYFNARGRAEICRLLFAAADVQYADKRIDFKDWSQWKNKMPCSMLPVLEIDGKEKWPQTMAIARFLAREFGFYPKTNLEMGKVDYISDCFYEVLCDWMRWYYEKDSDKKTEFKLRFENTFRRILPFLEKALEMNNGGKGWFVGSQMYLCDMMAFAALENPLRNDPNIWNKYPKIMDLRNRVAGHSKIGAYLNSRTPSAF